MLAGATVSDGFFYLLLQQKSAAPAGFFPLFYVITAAAYMLLSIPAGRLADRTSRSRVFLGGYGALLSELYPTEARATAENVLFNLGRGVGGFGPLVVGALVASYSFTVAIALLATIYLIDIVATLALIPEKKGQPLE